MKNIFLPDAGPRSDSCIFTICTKSYIGLANALGASMRDQGVPVDYIIVVVDGDISGEKSPYGRIVSAVEICDYSREHWKARTFRYDLVELCTSIKARCFRKFFDFGYDKVVYFDPDIVVFDNLGAIFSALDEHDVMATPHRLAYDSEIAARGGVFNLGFLAARRGLAADRVTAWWDARLETYSLNDPLRGYFTDQKWMDHLPVLLRHARFHVSGHPGMNLAPWNIGERTLARRADGWVVAMRDGDQDAAPLSFVHFSAFNYRLLAQGKDDERSREILEEMPAFVGPLAELKRYLKQGNFLDYASIPYGYSAFSDGQSIQQGHRRIFHRLLELDHTYPDPFDAAGPFYRKLRENRLLVGSGAGGQKARGVELNATIGRAASVLDTFACLSVRVLGYARFSQMSKLLVRYFHTNNHARLTQRRGEKVDVEYF